MWLFSLLVKIYREINYIASVSDSKTYCEDIYEEINSFPTLYVNDVFVFMTVPTVIT